MISERTRKRIESTSWSGRHYVEVYIVRDGSILATDHHDVVIQ
ncbi:nucleotide-binding domain-containing protein [Glycomyces luteolus]